MLGNVGVTFGTHICGGHAVISEVMLGEKYLDCGMGMMEMPEAAHDGQHFSKPPCCENQYVSIQVDEIFKKSIPQEIAPTFFATAIANILYTVKIDINEDQPIPVDTSPPLLIQDFQVLHQVFVL